MLFWIMLVTKQLLVHSDFHSIITAADQMCALARYNDISSKADRGEIFIVHDQKMNHIAHPYFEVSICTLNTH